MNILLLGPPASGKGTQAEALCHDFGLLQLSPGNMFRKHITDKTPLGLRVKQYLDLGTFVPDAITNDMVAEYLDTLPQQTDILFDGYPRDVGQAYVLDKKFEQIGRTFDMVIFLDVSDDEIVKRVSGRRFDPKTGNTYHLEFHPPPPGLAVEQREDDKPESVLRRLRLYHDITQPLVDLYESRGILVRLDGHQSIEDIHYELIQIIEERLFHNA